MYQKFQPKLNLFKQNIRLNSSAQWMNSKRPYAHAIIFINRVLKLDISSFKKSPTDRNTFFSKSTIMLII